MRTDDLTREVHAYIAAQVTHARVKKGLSKNRLAESAGLSQQMVSYVEKGMRNASLDTLLRISAALDLDLGAMLTHALRHTQRSAKKSAS